MEGVLIDSFDRLDVSVGRDDKMILGLLPNVRNFPATSTDV